jgi:hypothetical protein
MWRGEEELRGKAWAWTETSFLDGRESTPGYTSPPNKPRPYRETAYRLRSAIPSSLYKTGVISWSAKAFTEGKIDAGSWKEPDVVVPN